MAVVSRDATSGQWFPTSLAEAVSLYSGRTNISTTLAALYFFQETSGNVVDQTAGSALTMLTSISGSSYANTIAGLTRKGAKFVAGASDLSKVSFGTAQSALLFSYAKLDASAPAGNPESLVTLGNAFGNQVAANTVPASNPLKVSLDDHGGAGFGGTSTAGTQNVGGTLAPIGVLANVTTDVGYVWTSAETLSHTMNVGEDAHITFLAYGGDNTNYWFSAGMIVTYGVLWLGAAAEAFDATARAALIDCHENGPATSSIAVTPTSYSLVTLGATQAMVATSTRVDTSTFVSTASVTWASSNPAVATISAGGLVTAVANGTTNITASYQVLGGALVTSPIQVVTVSAGGGPTPPANTPRPIPSMVPGSPGIGFVA